MLVEVDSADRGGFMMMRGRSKAGRKPKAGPRYACGRLRPVRDQGNERVAALAQRFRSFQGGKADQWVLTSAIGRAWAVGLLDGHDVDPSLIRDAGLNYAARYWNYYPSTSGVGSYDAADRRGRAVSCDVADPRGAAFRRLDQAIAAAGSAAYDAVQSMVVDLHAWPQDNPDWLDRLINARLKRAGVPATGPEPLASDHDQLRLAVEGLMITIRGGRGFSPSPVDNGPGYRKPIS
ncbi:hypothetical protein [Sphingosinicella sp. BN140058]|uniref:hypothetical protein n=1 Tax=Sphingosinicella sp. BN140058 TaxID=1892855 RepID=UPI001011DDFF|nr:hypothetical protein [Sphingosinicella sp. BN140058]QAY75734.1 hypothetical protein ETR14_03725 [Sphingosinicella sp. BN140058]